MTTHDLRPTSTATISRRPLSRQWRVGFIGTGYIADWHARALSGLSSVRLEAACDLSRDRAMAFAQKHGVENVFTSPDEMLASRQLDAVHVLTPPQHHFAIARTALEAGVHVLIEKPMCTIADECRALEELARKAGLRLGVSHNFLFAPVYEKLRDDLEAKRFGPIDHVTITWHKELGQLRAGDTAQWMFDQPGNIMLEVGPHSVAHLIDIAGEPDALKVDVSRRMTLPTGKTFFRRWHVSAHCGETFAELNWSFGPGVSEHKVHVRGLGASAVADLEQGTYTVREHTPYNLDFDRYIVSRREAKAVSRQAARVLGSYVLGKFKLSKEGNLFESGIRRSLEQFYRPGEDAFDRRISGAFARSVIDLCERIASEANQRVPAGTEIVARPNLIDPKDPQVAPARVLVLGASGFIGRVLVRQLVGAGHLVRVLVRNPGKLPSGLCQPAVQVVKGDIQRHEDLDDALRGVEVVYHLARAHAGSWDEWVQHEVEATRDIAEACLRSDVRRLIYTGTIDSYYAAKGAGRITEETGLDPKIHRRNLYARAKAASEDVLLAMHRTQNLPVVIMRPGVVVGSGSSPFHWGVGFWPADTVCRYWGDGTGPVPLVLVDDVADALVRALDVPNIEGESFNLVADDCMSARQYIRELESGVGTKIDVRTMSPWRFYAIDLAKYAVKCLVRQPNRRLPSLRDWSSRSHEAGYDCTKAKVALDWHPKSSYEDLAREGVHLPVREWLA